MRALAVMVVIASLAAVVDNACAEAEHQINRNWPRWRGPLHNGVAPGASPPVEWSETKNIRWRVPIEGRGTSTPIIWGDRLFVATAVPIDKPLPRFYAIPKGTPRIGDHNAVTKSWKPQSLKLICIERNSGERLWERTAREVMPHQGHHWKGSFASASPITDGKHIYIYFGSFGLFCYDLEGNLEWQQDVCPQAMEDSLGEGSSPALWQDKLIVVVDHELQSFVCAIDKQTGRELWRTNREEVSNWSTPRIFEHAGQQQVIVNGQDVCCYDLSDGELLWKCGGQSEGAIPIPAIGHGSAYVTSGFAVDNFHAIELGRQGDLSGSKHIKWSLNRGTPYVPCPMLWGEEIYLLEDQSFFSCFRAADGKRHYFKKRVQGALDFSASPVGAADLIYLLSEQGKTVVLERGDEPNVVAVNTLDDTFYASPAIVGDSIYLRGEKYLYRIAKSNLAAD